MSVAEDDRGATRTVPAAMVEIGAAQLTVTLERRSHNPHLIEAGYAHSSTSIPWLHNLPLQIDFA